MLKRSSERGFTLIELIIVISIIALLSVIGITSFSSIQRDARNSKRKGDLKEIQKALEAYKTRNGEYPRTPVQASQSSGHRWLGTCSNYQSRSDTGSNGYIPDLAPVYIPKLPRDPRENQSNPIAGVSGCSNAGSNCYLYNSNGSDYKLLAHCSPEGTLSVEDHFYDSRRPRHAWQVSSSSNSRSW